MFVYNVLFILLFLFFLISYTKIGKKYSWILLIIAGACLFCVAAFKDLSVGSDSESYLNFFENIEQLSDNRFYSGIQIGWYYYSLFFYKYLSFNAFLFFNYAIIIGGFCYFFYKESRNYMASLLLMFLLCFFSSSLNIMRQYIAISIVLIGLTKINNSRIKFIICVVIASLFHFSAIAGAIFLVIKDKMNISNRSISLIIVGLSFLFGFFLTSTLSPIIQRLVVFDSFNTGVSGYVEQFGGERNIVSNLVINLMFVLSYICSRNRESLYLKSYFLYIVLSNLFGSMEQGNRLFLYFYMGILIAIPEISGGIKKAVPRYIYNVVFMVYCIGIWYISMNVNSGGVVPYKSIFN